MTEGGQDNIADIPPPRAFLSYARVDAERAEAIARMIERLGWQVWWDRELEGGAAFADTIEAELARADAVVVLWSAVSVRSDWVRDEAAAGRDKGRFVPITLDGTPAPLGFRQYQTIDCSRWGGRAEDADLAARIERALKPVVGGGAPSTALPRRRSRQPLRIGAAALVVAAAGGLAFWHPWRSVRPTQPTIAVLPFLDTSHSPDGRAFAEGVSEEILNLIARDTRLRVLGRTSGAMLAAHAGDPRAIERELGVTHLLEGSVRTVPDRVRVDVRLVKLPEGGSVFAQDFDRRPTDIFAVQSEIGQAVASRLGVELGGKEAAGTRQIVTTPAVYTAYLAARQLLRTRQPAEMQRARALLLNAVAADPRYAPALAGLAEAEVLLAADQYGDTPVPQAVAAARGYATRAAALAPGLSQSHAALGQAAIEAGENARAIAELRRAVALDPHRVETLDWLGYALSTDGRPSEAAVVMRQAVALEPLWFRPRVTAMFTLARIGARDEIARMAESFVAIAPDAAAGERVQMAAALRLGRFADAVRIADHLLVTSPGDPQALETLVEAGINTFRFDIALKGLPGPPSITSDLMRGNPDGAIEYAKRAGRTLWDNPTDLYYAAAAFSQRQRWSELVALYDARYRTPEQWLANTVDPTVLTVGPTMALALDRVGRTGEARRVRELVGARLRLLQARGLSPIESAWVWAALMSATGERTAAVHQLESAVAVKPSVVCGGPVHIERAPEMAALAADPGFRAVGAQCERWLQAQYQLMRGTA